MFGTIRTARTLMLAVLALGLSAGMVAANRTAGLEGTALKVELSEWSLGFGELKAKSGSITLQMVNVGRFPHNFVVRKAGSGEVVYQSPILRGSQSATGKLDLPAGQYELYCSVPGHEQRGMLAALTVSG